MNKTQLDKTLGTVKNYIDKKDYITSRDTRNANETPNEMQQGLSVHLKSNGKDGLSDGGSYHPAIHIKPWDDYSGGPYAQIALTQNQNLQFRTSSSGTAWNAWKKVSVDGHTHSYAGSSSVGGSANSAVKLATARTINGTSFDGSANITTANWGTTRKLNRTSVNGSADVSIPLDYITCGVSNDNTNNYHLILESGQCTGDYTDKSIVIMVCNHYNNNSFGIAKATLRTNKASGGDTAAGELIWIVRSGFAANVLCYNIRNTAKDTYMDVFYKSTGTYNSATIYILGEGARGNQSSQWTKNNTNASGTKAYTETAMKALRTYTSTLVSAVDAGVVNKANQLATARNIKLAGDVTGSASFNGSADATITATVTKPPKSGDWFSGGIPSVSTGGVMEIGKYIDFHNTDASTNDYDVRLQTSGAHQNTVSLPTGTGTLALTTDNVASANKLYTARTLTIGNKGKTFDGSANVSWSLSEIGALPLSGGTLTGATTFNNYLILNAWSGYGSGTANFWYDANNKTVEIENATNLKLAGTKVSKEGHTHKSFECYGSNTITSTTNDTTAKWGALKNSVHWYSTTGQLTNQPGQYGILCNFTNGSSEVHQLWLTQSSGSILHRGGNASNWSGSWRTILDSSNYSSYALPLSGGTLTGATTFNDYLKLNAWTNYGTGTADFWYDGTNKTVEIETATDLKLNGTKVSKSGHTHNYAGSSSAGGTANSAARVDVSRLTGSSNSANYVPGANRLVVREYGSDCSNMPSAHYYHIYTGQGSDASYNTQLAVGMTTAALYYRNRNNGTWSSWTKVATSGHNHDSVYLKLSGGTLTGATTFNDYLKLNAWSGYGTGTADFWYDGTNKTVEIETATDLKLNGTKVSKSGHNHDSTYLKLSGGTVTGTTTFSGTLNLTGSVNLGGTGGNLYFANNKGIALKNTGGTDRWVLYMDTSNRVLVGDTNQATRLQGSSITLAGTSALILDSNNTSCKVGYDSSTGDGYLSNKNGNWLRMRADGTGSISGKQIVTFASSNPDHTQIRYGSGLSGASGYITFSW